jgi:aminomethyltransferase
MLKKTPLHEAHIEAKAKMGEFAGYDMPLYYAEGVMKEHEWVRASCGVFDVSHMGQAMITGAGALNLLEKLTPSSFAKLKKGRTKYSVLLNEQGGIIDDLMITRSGEDSFHLVLNAGRKDADIAWIKSHLPAELELKYFEDWALLALQGPQAEAVMRDVLGLDLSDMAYMDMRGFNDDTLFISRLGYTGEDGFEISVQNKDARGLWDKLLAHGAVKPIGLAARDSLRLDMGYCLYGHDIDENTTPVEADLGWVIGKENTSFIGADTVLKQREQGAARKRVGIRLLDKGVAREGAEIRNADDRVIGALTSGGFSPSLKESIGQGYVEIAHANIGEDVFVNVRGRNIATQISAMPFVEAHTKGATKKSGA